MRKRVDQEWMKHWDFILLDILCLHLAFVLAGVMLRGFVSPYGTPALRYQAAVLAVCQLAVMPFAAGYFAIVRRTVCEEVWAVVKFIVTTMALALVYLFAVQATVQVSRLQMGLTTALFVVLDVALRQGNKRRIFASHKADNKRTLVLVTSAAQVRGAIEKLTNKNTVQYFKLSEIVLMDGGEVGEFADLGLPVYPLDDHAVQNICHMHVDEVFVLQPDDMLYPSAFIDQLMEMGITVNYTNSFLAEFAEIHRLGMFDVLTTAINFAPAAQLAVKRLLDILGGAVGCLFTGLIFLFVAPAIYRQSPGPIFFAQPRVGQNGKIFKMYKFRSMYMDAEERKAELMARNKIADGMMFKMDDDPRIIGSEKKDKNGKPRGIGNFIRNTSLDEFPQFFNVLKGDMSLVGTRPPTRDEWEKYDLRHRVRMSARPGITGMWQVSGRSDITDFEEVVALDKYYIEHWSLGLDVQILFKTVLAVLRHQGAA